MNISCPLYINSFNPIIWKNSDKIDYLLKTKERMESIINGYLDDVRNNFPQLTDHSINHSKMLWNYASIIVGNKKEYLNPMEGFVLHSAFLIHDSGMCYSILNNKDEIENDPIYKDYLIEYKDTDENRNEALFYTVRNRHGDYAERVATEKLKHGEYLIEDYDLREELALIIGKIAKSHTCSVNYIERELDYVYTSPNYPVDWSIDCSKLAFILRTADAAHLDNLRTPKSYKLIYELGGVSKHHWIFQKKLGFPTLSDENNLIYSTNTPFNKNQQKAWWYCYNAIKVLDSELKKANEFFEINKKESFCARGVKAIDDTLLLGKKFIRTIEWEAIDTQIKVSNPVHIASELGGIRLYGQMSFALRELIQNSIDAINLHRVHTGQTNINLGEIKVSLEEEEKDIYLIVTDNGIGMSQTLMCNELLDFGGSYWKSSRFNFDFEGIKAKGFNSIGKFGIGFFSVFMLGQKITVTSWKFGEGIEKMKTLDFYDGLFSSPILRDPYENEKERILDRGTSVKIRLDIDPYTKEGFIGKHQFKMNNLFELIKYYVPGCNIKISIKELDGNIKIIEPEYPYKLKAKELLDYFHIITDRSDFSGIISIYKMLNIELIDVVDDDRNYGKLVMLPIINGMVINSTGLILSKGIRVVELPDFLGYIFTDDIVSIKRDIFSKLVPFETMKKWAILQRKQIEERNYVQLYSHSYFALLFAFDFYTDEMPIALSKRKGNYKYVSITEFKDYLSKNLEVKIHQEGHSLSRRNLDCNGFIFLPLNLKIQNIIKEEEQDKIIKYDDKLNSIIAEVWGEYIVEEEDLFKKTGRVFDLPYMRIQKFIKVI